MPPPVPSEIVSPSVNECSQDYQELLAKILSLPIYPKKRIVSYLLGDGHFLRFISNRIDFPSYVLQHESAVYSADFNRAGDKIVSGADDGSVRVWNVSTREYKVLVGHTGEVWSVSFNAAGDTIVSGADDGTVRVWDLTTGECKVLVGHTRRVFSARFNRAGDKVVSSSRDGTVRVWDTASGACRVFHGHTDCVIEACFNEAGDKVASSSRDGTMRVWDLSIGDCKILRHYRNDVVDALCFTEGDTKMVSFGNNTVRIWDLATMKFLERQLFWSCDGRANASINLAKNRVVVPIECDIVVFDITGDNWAICELNGHSRQVSFAKFNEVGDKLISTSYDRTVRVWDFSVFEQFKESCFIEWVLVLNAVYEVIIARDFKERFPEERLALIHSTTSDIDDMFFRFSMFGDTLKDLLERSYEDLPPPIQKIFNEYILSE